MALFLIFYLPFHSHVLDFPVWFGCTGKESQEYECLDYVDVGKLQIYFKDGTMHAYANYVQLSSNSEPILHHIRSKDKTFSKGTVTPCYPSLDPIIKVVDVEKGSKKEQLLKSINIKDVIIYDLDYHEDFVIAVGEDNSPQMRERQSQEEDHESVILRSTDSGKTWERLEESTVIPNDHVIVLDEKRVIIGASIEGAGGSVSVSSDGGHNWSETYSGGMIKSLELIGEEIVLTDIVDTKWKSKDGGKSWLEEVTVEDIQDIVPANDEKNIPQVKEKSDRNVLFIGGGVIPEKDVPQLIESGIARTFGPGTPLSEISNFIETNIKSK